jgi:hypothetical protein
VFLISDWVHILFGDPWQHWATFMLMKKNLVMLCEYRDNRLANSIYGPYGHFTYLQQSQTSGRKVFCLSINFTCYLMYVTRVAYELCCTTYMIIT